MNRNKGIWMIIACIIIVGAAVTVITARYVKSRLPETQTEASQTQEMMMAPGMLRASGQESRTRDSGPLAGEAQTTEPSEADTGVIEAVPFDSSSASEETEAVISPLDGAVPALVEEDNERNRKDYYEDRLEDLDAQVQKMRTQETDPTTYSLKTAAENELRLWDRELNEIYTVILGKLDQEAAGRLVQEERQWMKDRDAKAVEASKRYNGGSMEGLEYTASLASATRARAYELVEEYFPDEDEAASPSELQKSKYTVVEEPAN